MRPSARSSARPGRTFRRPAFTLIELIIVIILIGVLAAVGIPRLRPSAPLQVRSAAGQLVNDLEQARARAMSTRRPVRVSFDVGDATYAGFLGVVGTPFSESAEEMDALRAFARRSMEPNIVFGRGAAAALPGDPGAAVITLPDNRVEFNSRGVTVPFGTRGVVYLRHANDDAAVSAVSINGAGTLKVWHYVNGIWQ
jgi:prepilin-type N-terminal cleavage/methylation domain-containing protein